MNDQDIDALMAYADGELEHIDVRKVEQLLAVSAEARALVDSFRQTRATIATAMDEVLDEPVPQRLIDSIRSRSAAATPSPGAAPSTPSGAAIRAAANDRAFWPSLATAASLALVIGLFTGQWWASQGDPQVASAPDLHQALETLPAGESLSLAGARITPLSSHRGEGGLICREFERADDGRLALGVACRTETRWVAKLVMDQGPVGSPAGAPVFAPASGAPDLMSEFLDRLQLGPALSAAEERAVMAQGWVRP